MEVSSLHSSLSLLFVFLLLVIGILFPRRRHGNLPPSPPAVPILGHLHLLKQPVHRSLQRLSLKYGPIFSLRFGSQLVVIVSSPSAVEECFTKNDVVLANRPRLASGKYLGFNYTSVVSASYGEHWRNLRRLCAREIFSSNRLNMFLGIRRDEVKLLLLRLARDSREGFAKVELRPMLTELTFNIITRMVAGKRYYGEGVEFEEAKRFREIISEAFKLNHEKKLKKTMRETEVILQGLIDEHRGGNDRGSVDNNSMIDHLLSLQTTEPEYYTDDIIKGLVLILILAGTDTSAATMEWAMTLLLNHPDFLKKAKAELDIHVGKDRLIEESDLPKLRHILLINAWAIHRDPQVWEDPTSFIPERFENGERENYKLLPFGIGRRACPGAGLAHRVMGLALGSLIQCYEWKRISKTTIDTTEGKGLTMPKLEPLEAMCKACEIIKTGSLELENNI
ncbi:hypothetical protein AAG906_034081 [Vitis piasezkii]